MGSYTFKWGHPASEVYVTGTFDDWSKSEKLSKVGNHFEKHVTLADASKKIYYKFVVDGDWVTDHTAPKEADESGNENNVLTPDRIISSGPATTHIMSSAAPESTTAALAKDVPLEKETEPVQTLSSAAPQSTTAELAKDVPLEHKGSEKPEGLPGTFPETPAADLNKEFSINPLPAAEGAVNPIKLAPGEPIPQSITAQSTTDHVKLDKESYEKSDAIPGIPEIPPVSKNTIPESGLPIVGATGAGAANISSAAPGSTTAQLAAGAPLEANVPATVIESQKKADFPPEASAVPEEVKDKAAVEDELLEKVAEAPSTSEGTAGKGTEKSEKSTTAAGTTAAEAAAAVAGAATAIGGAVIAGAFAAKDKFIGTAAPAAETAKDKFIGTAVPAAETAQVTATEQAAKLPESVKEKLPVSAQNAIGTTAKEDVLEEVAPAVPTEVKQSIAEAGKGPEAAANSEAVADKKAVEAELLKEVKPAAAADESSAKKNTTNENGEKMVPLANSEAAPTAAPVPAPVTESKAAATGSEAVTPATPANATTAEATTPGSSKTTDSPATTDKKKKNRLSTFIGKIKGKVSK